MTAHTQTLHLQAILAVYATMPESASRGVYDAVSELYRNYFRCYRERSLEPLVRAHEATGGERVAGEDMLHEMYDIWGAHDILRDKPPFSQDAIDSHVSEAVFACMISPYAGIEAMREMIGQQYVTFYPNWRQYVHAFATATQALVPADLAQHTVEKLTTKFAAYEGATA